MRKLVLLFALCACVLVGCDRDPINIVEIEEEQQVVVNFSATESSLKSPGTPAERLVNDIILFGADATGNLTRYADISGTTTTTLTISKAVKTFYAIANPTTALRTAAAPVTTLTALQNLTGTYGAATQPGSPFIMSGSVAIDNSTVTINLIRTVAKVNINALNGLVISSVEVQNTPLNVYAFQKSSFAVPAGMTSYTGSTSLYVTENVSTSPTRFVVTGTYLSEPANYTITLKQSDANIDIKRNTIYSVDIEPTTTTSCIVSFTVVDWADVNTDPHIIP